MASASGETIWTNVARDPLTKGFHLGYDSTFIHPHEQNSPYESILLHQPLSDEKEKCFVLTHDNSNNRFEGGTMHCTKGDPTTRILCAKYASTSGGGATSSSCSTSDDDSRRGPDQSGVSREEATAASRSFLERLINPAHKHTRYRSVVELQTIYRNAFMLLDKMTSYPSLFEILWYSHLPCSDTKYRYDLRESPAMLKRCEFKGMVIGCDRLFKTFPTDRGMCCVFNFQDAEKIFHESVHRNMIRSMQKRDESIYGKPSPLDERIMETEAGVHKGLKVYLDAHTNMVGPGTVEGDLYGFVAVVGAPNQFPLTSQKQILLRPGYENLVAITATNVNAANGLNSSLSSEERDCLFEDDLKLEYFTTYSQNNCFMECKIRETQKALANSSTCSPWYLPGLQAEMCDPWDAELFSLVMKEIPEKSCGYCLPDCNATFYQTSISAVPFRKCTEKNLGLGQLCNFDINPPVSVPQIFAEDIIAAFKDEDKNEPPAFVPRQSNWRKVSLDSGNTIFPNHLGLEYDAYEVDIAVAHFYFESSTVFQFTRQVRLTDLGFLAQVGGLLGLCLGFSICSGVEILYWIIVFLWRSVMDKRHEDTGVQLQVRRHSRLSHMSETIQNNTRFNHSF